MPEATPATTTEMWSLPEHPSAESFDWDLAERLCNDRTLVDLGEVATMCGMTSRQSAYFWLRGAQNYRERGLRTWPPTGHSLRNLLPKPESQQPPAKALLHPSILPPPDVPGGGRGLDRWYKGTIYAWGMRTRRISPTGEPVARVAGPAPGRGPAHGRRLTTRKDAV